MSNYPNDKYGLLGLFLWTNVNVPRLDSTVAWDFLTLRDLYQLQSVSKSTFSALEMVEYNRCRDVKGRFQISFRVRRARRVPEQKVPQERRTQLDSGLTPCFFPSNKYIPRHPPD